MSSKDKWRQTPEAKYYRELDECYEKRDKEKKHINNKKIIDMKPVAHGYLYYNEEGRLKTWFTDSPVIIGDKLVVQFLEKGKTEESNKYIDTYLEPENVKKHRLANTKYHFSELVNPENIIYHLVAINFPIQNAEVYDSFVEDLMKGKNKVFNKIPPEDLNSRYISLFLEDSKHVTKKLFVIDTFLDSFTHYSVVNNKFIDEFQLFLQSESSTQLNSFVNYSLMREMEIVGNLNPYDKLLFFPLEYNTEYIAFWNLFIKTFGISKETFKELSTEHTIVIEQYFTLRYDKKKIYVKDLGDFASYVYRLFKWTNEGIGGKLYEKLSFEK